MTLSMIGNDAYAPPIGKLTPKQWIAAAAALGALADGCRRATRSPHVKWKIYTTEREVAILAGVSRDTARIALLVMTRAGLVRKQPASGSRSAQYLPGFKGASS